MPTLEEVRAQLEAAGLTVSDERRVDDNQVQLAVEGLDAVINIWHSTGTCNVQGREKVALTERLGDLVSKGKGRKRSMAAPVAAASALPSTPKKVFVVYGHDEVAIAEVDAMLRRWGLEPVILDQLASHGNTIIEKLEHYQEGVGWAVVLLTPDDIGHPALDPSKAAPRPRQNVVLEMGMLLGRLGRSHVVMLYRRSEPAMELPSDIQGYLYIPYTTQIKETGQQLAKEMSSAGSHEVPVSKV